MKRSNSKITAWSVHAYTMLGGVLGMIALSAIAANETRLAWFLLFLAFIIDTTDGILARKYRVREVLPHFDGAKIDDLIDFLTFVWAPVLILHTEQLVTNPIWLAIPVIGSLFAYGHTGMKEVEGEAYFLRFPSYWNVLVLYLYWLRPPEMIVILLLLVCMVLSFIPTRYLYPSKNPKYPLFTFGLALIWVPMMLALLSQPEPNPTWVIFSMFYPIYYMGMSFYIELSYHTDQMPLRN